MSPAGKDSFIGFCMGCLFFGCRRSPKGVGRRTLPGHPKTRSAPAPVQRLLSMNAVSWDLETAPTLVASTSPSLNSISVGMPRIP